MKFATTKEHRDFFQKQGWIEFEGLVPNDQLDAVNQAIDQTLAERLNTSPDNIGFSSSEKLYLQGRDLWRSHPVLHKFVTQPRFAEIAVELIEKKPLRLGYDQLFPSCYHPLFEISSAYSQFLKQIASLEAVSCLQGVACGLVFALSEKASILPERQADGVDIFPNQAGHAIFFRPNVPVNWANVYSHFNQRFYLIVYTFASAYYQLQPHDPHTHALKRLGYIFNDRLSDKLNPIVYR
jgi:hypothetical protein